MKGSGSDLASATERSFTELYLDDLAPLLERARTSTGNIRYVDGRVAAYPH